MTQEFILRLFAAAVMGGIIGMERGYRAKEAGVRTHFLVALGSALFMIVSQFGFETVLGLPYNIRLDPSRIASQVVSGIGFIGAGTIIFQKHVVKGLTTAAGLWVTAAIGMTCGSGLYILASATTLLVLLCLETLNLIMHHFGTRNIAITFSSPSINDVRNVLDRLRNDGMKIDNYNMREVQKDGKTLFSVTTDVIVKRDKYESRVLGIMEELNGVKIESIE
ncbi:MAG: MgtC/SapB family protein [Prevotella sp.]|jgi:putative Mg2+ transporter-C (MgtC) family protein|nr:MgtC/SapB family protein [Prevotella sp.]